MNSTIELSTKFMIDTNDIEGNENLVGNRMRDEGNVHAQAKNLGRGRFISICT